MNPKTKIAADKRDELVQLYLLNGLRGVEALAKEYGVTPKYVANATNLMGLRRNNSPRTHGDPRWADAIERGPVLA